MKEVVQIQEVYTDAVKIATNPFTLRIMVGSDLNGEFSPNVMLSMSPQFAIQFHEAFAEAVEQIKKNIESDNQSK